MQLHDHAEQFEQLGVVVLAVSQEEKDLSSALSMAEKTGVRFPLLHDVDRRTAPRLDRTTGYYVDADGVVRQVFPMTAYLRPSTDVVLAEIERLRSAERAEPGDEDDARR